MFNLLELQTQRSHKVLSIKELVDKAEKDENGARPLTAEECQLFDRLNEEVGKLDEQIAAVQAHNRRSEATRKLVEDLDRPQGRTTPADPVAIVRGGDGTSAVTPFRIPASARRTGVLKAFKGVVNGVGAEERAYRAGLWARAVLFRSEWAQQRCMDLGIRCEIRNAMGTTSNPDGGVLVPDELSQAIIDLREEYGVFRRYCRTWPMGSDTLMIPRRAGGVTIGPLGENPAAGPTATNPTFDMVQLVAKKAGGLTVLSTEIAEDAVIDLADWIANEYAYAFALFEDQCGFIGDGTSTYLGVRGLTNLLTEASGLAGAVLAAAGHDTFAEVDNTDLTSAMGKLPAYARMNAAWYCSATCADVVFSRLGAVAGGNTTQTLREGVGLAYLGYPIRISQVLPSATTAVTDGTAMLFFGDLSKSSNMGDRRMVRLMTSRDRYMELDQIAILGTERVDIVNSDVGTTTTPGPIIALLGNAS